MKFLPLKTVAKWAWLCAVITFVAVYAIKKQDVLTDMIKEVPLSSIILAGGAIVIAKAFLMLHMKACGARFGIVMGMVESFRVYNLTQLAKYIPGSIWQFVGRFSIYKAKNHTLATIRDALLAEHFWLVGGAFLMGAFCILASAPNPVATWMFANNWKLATFILIVGLVSCVALGALLLRYRSVQRWTKAFVPSIEMVGGLLVIWLALGASLWVLAGPFAGDPLSYVYLVGVYSIAFGVGFLVPFAPAGLGVREVVFVVALANNLDADAAIMVAAINRVLYFLVEVSLGVFSMPLKENNQC